MASPIKNLPVSTAYRVKGKHWSTGYHTGIDIKCPVGTPVYAAVDGKVCPGGWGSAYGKQIVVDQKPLNDGTPNRIAGGWAIYAHLSEVKVKAGQEIKKGDLIGLSGNTGNSTGPHLHYEVRNQERWTGGKDRDPMPFINA
jgi:murein DD-endopeptidase MepM/ murein hydrolase activator NlpD